MRKKGKLARLDIKSFKSESLPFKAKMKVDHLKQKEQIFEEAWRMLRDSFYDPEFHGRDFKALKNKYKSRCLSAFTMHDFREMFNWMIGQLNASHMGMYGKGREKTQKEESGMIGLEVHPVEDGVKITRVIPDSPADREISKLRIGDKKLTRLSCQRRG